MKFKVKTKIIINSPITKVIIVTIMILSLFLAIILPSIFLSPPKGSVTAYNRDPASGTREVFAEKVLTEKEFTPGNNVREVSSNDSMLRVVSQNKDSIGYVSFETVAGFNDDETVKIKPEYEDEISFLLFADKNGNPVSPTKKNIILGMEGNGEGYTPARSFNIFFRVVQGSEESKILNYDWDNIDNNSEWEEISLLDDNLLISYLFMNWVMYSHASYNYMNDNGEIPFNSESMLWTDDEQSISDYINFTHLSEGEDLTIGIVGSTSVKPLIADLSKEFIDLMNIYEIDVVFNISTNGSSDAFKKSIPGINNPYIGVQSRNPKDSELESWGWEEGSQDEVYGSFVIDAILIIYNIHSSYKLEEGEEEILDGTSLYTNSKLMLELYTSQKFMSYKDIFIKVSNNEVENA